MQSHMRASKADCRRKTLAVRAAHASYTARASLHRPSRLHRATISTTLNSSPGGSPPPRPSTLLLPSSSASPATPALPFWKEVAVHLGWSPVPPPPWASSCCTRFPASSCATASSRSASSPARHTATHTTARASDLPNGTQPEHPTADHREGGIGGGGEEES